MTPLHKSNMLFFNFQNRESYLQFKADKAAELEGLKKTEIELQKQFDLKGTYYHEGYSWPLQRNSRFLVDNKYSSSNEINFRERLVCYKTRFNNRIRGAIHVFEELLCPNLNDQIYITEQHSLLYKWLKKKYVNTVGSEFMTASSYLDILRFRIKLFPQKLNHQDLTQLSFDEEMFKFILSFDCFEHIPDYQIGLNEIYRVLKTGSTLLFSVPFNLNAKETLVRASVNSNGSTDFHIEPEYHGNPMSKKGSLSYYTFGWELLDALREIGFKEVNAIIYWSKKYAYLGGEQLLISAEK